MVFNSWERRNLTNPSCIMEINSRENYALNTASITFQIFLMEKKCNQSHNKICIDIIFIPECLKELFTCHRVDEIILIQNIQYHLLTL